MNKKIINYIIKHLARLGEPYFKRKQKYDWEWLCHYLAGTGTKMVIPDQFFKRIVEYPDNLELNNSMWIHSGACIPLKGISHGFRPHRESTKWHRMLGKFLIHIDDQYLHILDRYEFYESCGGVDVSHHRAYFIEEVCSRGNCVGQCDEPEWLKMDLKWFHRYFYRTPPKFLKPLLYKIQAKWMHTHKEIEFYIGPIGFHATLSIWVHEIHGHTNVTISDEWFADKGVPFYSVAHYRHSL